MMLRDWDFYYTGDSKAATLFHRIYKQVLSQIFGGGLFGTSVWEYLEKSTGLLPDFFPYFDDVAAGEVDPGLWFEDGDSNSVYKSAIAEVWQQVSSGEVPKWGDGQQVTMTNILFDGKLPKFLGFDYGPIPLHGCSATLVQAAIFNSAGRATSFFPSYRFITDLGKMEAWTAIAGGPSGKRFSRYYRTDIEMWRSHQYKLLCFLPSDENNAADPRTTGSTGDSP